MTGLFSVDEILAATGGRAENVAIASVSSISIDSRQIEAGALFVAIAGERFDGHDFVKAAIDAGAGAALVSKARAGGLAGLPLVVVPDALEGLCGLARAARARSRAKIVAVTGSVGKTTTKEAIALALAPFGPVHASIKSFNNHWGVPLMLARMPPEARFGVFEIGMNHAGEITPLTQLVRPQVAVVTTVAAAHIGFFDSLAGIAEAKAEIFRGLERGGTAIINADHGYWQLLAGRAEAAGAGRSVTYGFAKDADARLLDGGDGPVRAKMGRRVLAMPPIGGGRHMMANALAALCVVQALGFDPGPALQALAKFTPSAGRGAVLRLGSPDNPIVLIDESYNANPASMAAVLEAFCGQRAGAGGRKFLVLGDMFELGSHSAELHRDLAGPVRKAGADRVYLAGPEMAALAGQLGAEAVTALAPSAAAIGDRVLDELAPGDLIMVKGSLGMGLGSLAVRLIDRFGLADDGGQR